jgi:hypothetical protein
LSNPTDSVTVLLNQTQSGLVVSGNPNISIVKQVTSGSSISSFRQSGTGPYEYVMLHLARNQTDALTGGRFTAVADYVAVEFFCKYPVSVSGGTPSSGAVITVQQRMNDFKTTVLSGVWGSGSPAIPTLVAEKHPVEHQQVARGSLEYRFRYLL